MTTQTYPTRDELVLAAQLIDAELSVLEIYDDQRRALGYDYGNGQRHAELIRVRRDRDRAVTAAHRYGYGMGVGDLHASREQCVEALRRISRPKLTRVTRAQRQYRTRSGELALAAWQRTADEIGRMEATR